MTEPVSIIELLLKDNCRYHDRYNSAIESINQNRVNMKEIIDLEEYQAVVTELEVHRNTVNALTIKYNSLEKEKLEIEFKYQYLLNMSDDDIKV